MTVQITIIGLGQIGTSIGLALAKHSETVKRVGHDKQPEVARAAQKKGALDKVEFNLPAAARQADLVLLTLPVSEIEATLKVISRDLKKGAVVMDTAPIKSAVSEWVKKLLPDGNFYVGLVPVINPAYLHIHETGMEAAREDLFHKGLLVIASPPGTPGEAIALATDLAHLLGASSFFADQAEIDGLMASTHLLPQLVAAALVNATVDQPGWLEARKLAGHAYAMGTAPIIHQDETDALCAAALLNRENVIRVLDNMIASLQGLRGAISNKDKGSVDSRLEEAYKGQVHWLRERFSADWASEEYGEINVPSFGERLQQMVIGGLSRKPRK